MAFDYLPSNFELHKRTRIEGDVAYITLSQGYEAIIDAADVVIVGQYCWSAEVKSNYVAAHRKQPIGNGKCKNLYLHRAIMQPPEHLVVDHIDGNPLNNRRSNLRLASKAENGRNAKLSRANSTGLKGVTWDRRYKKWRAQITCNKINRNLGRFDCPQKAHQAYLKAAQELFGEFARSG
jgi:hypothetical protein